MKMDAVLDLEYDAKTFGTNNSLASLVSGRIQNFNSNGSTAGKKKSKTVI